MSDSLRPQYEILERLRLVDEKIFRLNTGLEQIPQEIAKLEQALLERRTLVTTAKTAFEAIEKKFKNSELDLKVLESKIDKASSKMMEVKTNDEYQASLREIEELKQQKSGIEDGILTLLAEVDAARSVVKDQDSVFKGYETALLEDKKRLEDEKKRLEARMEEELVQRKGAVEKLETSVAGLYTRICTHSKSAVAAIENSVCLGCRTKVRSQLYNEILGFKTIHRCPTCGRILVASPPPENLDNSLASK